MDGIEKMYNLENLSSIILPSDTKVNLRPPSHMKLLVNNMEPIYECEKFNKTTYERLKTTLDLKMNNFLTDFNLDAKTMSFNEKISLICVLMKKFDFTENMGSELWLNK
jgi:hypothetical protein